MYFIVKHISIFKPDVKALISSKDELLKRIDETEVLDGDRFLIKSFTSRKAAIKYLVS